MTLYLSSSRVFRTEAKFKYEFQLKVTVYIKEFEGRLLLSISEATWYSHENNTRDKNMRYSFIKACQLPLVWCKEPVCWEAG